jgi:hypothetical protein
MVNGLSLQNYAHYFCFFRTKDHYHPGLLKVLRIYTVPCGSIQKAIYWFYAGLYQPGISSIARVSPQGRRSDLQSNVSVFHVLC